MEWEGTRKVTLLLFCPPVPASRPRVTKWGTYYGKTYKQYMQQADMAIPPAPGPIDGNLVCRVEFVCVRPRTTKRLSPRGDIDNYLKAILDAVTKKGYWHDDDQIVRIAAKKRFAEGKETPHTRIEITAE